MNKEPIKNEGTSFEGGVNFDTIFTPMRERRKGNWVIERGSKKSLEQSIARSKKAIEKSIKVINKGSIACTNGSDLGVVG